LTIKAGLIDWPREGRYPALSIADWSQGWTVDIRSEDHRRSVEPGSSARGEAEISALQAIQEQKPQVQPNDREVLRMRLSEAWNEIEEGEVVHAATLIGKQRSMLCNDLQRNDLTGEGAKNRRAR
jgi:hypothetical protein